MTPYLTERVDLATSRHLGVAARLRSRDAAAMRAEYDFDYSKAIHGRYWRLLRGGVAASKHSSASSTTRP
jgi:hypothetical protein